MRIDRARCVRFAGVALVLAGICLFAGCRLPTTVYGQLALKPGEQGDVRLARVELHDSVAWDSAPVYTVTPEAGGQSRPTWTCRDSCPITRSHGVGRH